MALKFRDSFDHYATSDILRKWTQVHGSADVTEITINTGGGRRGTNALRIEPPPAGARRGLGRVVVPGTTTAYVGTAFRGSGSGAGWGTLTTPAGGGNSLNMVDANAGALDVTVNQVCSIRNSYYTHVAASLNNNGTISLYRGNADSLGGAGLQGQDRIAATLGTSSQALLYDQTSYIELKVVVHPSAGSVLLKVNGDVWFTASGINTQAAGASAVTAWQELLIGGHLGTAVATYWYYDDLYLGDSDATDAFNQLVDLAGDVMIDYSNVFQDGSTLQWTPLTGPSHYPEVDDNPPDLDTTYNATTTFGNTDTFLKNVVPIVGATIVAVSPIYLARRTEGGATSTAAVLRDAGTNFIGSQSGSGVAIGNTSTYTYDWWSVTQRPSASGTPLTQALVDAMEAGYRKVT